MHIYTVNYTSSQRIGFFLISKYFVTIKRKVGYVLARLPNYFTVTAILFFFSAWSFLENICNICFIWFKGADEIACTVTHLCWPKPHPLQWLRDLIPEDHGQIDQHGLSQLQNHNRAWPQPQESAVWSLNESASQCYRALFLSYTISGGVFLLAWVWFHLKGANSELTYNIWLYDHTLNTSIDTSIKCRYKPLWKTSTS